MSLITNQEMKDLIKRIENSAFTISGTSEHGESKIYQDRSAFFVFEVKGKVWFKTRSFDTFLECISAWKFKEYKQDKEGFCDADSSGVKKENLLKQQHELLLSFTKSFIKDFETNYMSNGKIVDDPCLLTVVNYEAAKAIVKQIEKK